MTKKDKVSSSGYKMIPALGLIICPASAADIPPRDPTPQWNLLGIPKPVQMASSS